jgi:hypothetical protein
VTTGKDWVRASAARRQATVTARRKQVAAVRHQLVNSLRHRQEIAVALVRLRRSLVEFRGEVRSRLRDLAADVVDRRTGPKGAARHAPSAD